MQHITESQAHSLGTRTETFRTVAADSRSTGWTSLLTHPRRGNCLACDLPHWSVTKAYALPRLRGWSCSISCVECTLFGSGRCRWCGILLLPSGSKRFCSDACRRRSGVVKFGDGTRLLQYLAKNDPERCRKISGAHSCLRCGKTLTGKRHDAIFCSGKCRKAYRRTPRTAELCDPEVIGDNGPLETMTSPSAKLVVEGDYQLAFWGPDRGQYPSKTLSGRSPEATSRRMS
jgi:hypothetical protein